MLSGDGHPVSLLAALSDVPPPRARLMAFLLVIYLGIASAWDIVTRTIPLPISMAALGGSWLLLVSDPAATLPIAIDWTVGGFFGATVCLLMTAPAGDFWALAVVGTLVGALWGQVWMAGTFALVLGTWLTALLIIGRRRSMIGWPFVPWLAVAVGAVAVLWWVT